MEVKEVYSRKVLGRKKKLFLPGLWKSVYFLINCVIQTGIVQSAHERLNEVHCPGTRQGLMHVCTCSDERREGEELAERAVCGRWY